MVFQFEQSRSNGTRSTGNGDRDHSILSNWSQRSASGNMPSRTMAGIPFFGETTIYRVLCQNMEMWKAIRSSRPRWSTRSVDGRRSFTATNAVCNGHTVAGNCLKKKRKSIIYLSSPHVQAETY